MVIDVSKLTGQDAETQKLRYEALKGRNAIILSGSMFVQFMSNGMKDQFRWQLAQGINSYVVFHDDQNPIYKIMTEDKLYTHAVFADLEGDNAAKNIAEAARALGVEIHGVYSPYEHMQPVVGAVAEELGLFSNPAKAYSLARNKHATRDALRAAGLNTPASMEINSLDDVDAAAEHVGFPLIVKPTSGAASLGVYRADSKEELQQKVEQVLNELARSATLSFNPGVKAAPIMVEQFIVPHASLKHYSAEVDNDLLFWDGECVYGTITDNWASVPPYFLETCEHNPSLLPSDMYDEMLNYAIGCVKALGFKVGCFHMEAIYSTTGPVLIECNPRLGGGPTNMFNTEVWGVNLAENYFVSMMGIPINPPRHPKPVKCMAEYYVNCPLTGTLVKADFFDNVKSLDPRVVRTFYFVKDGQEVKGYDTQIADWVGTITMESFPEDMENVCDTIESIVQGLRFNIAPKETPKRRASRKASVNDTYA